ncbi:chaperone protein dnaJ 49 [Artemisia annua]|uniref:Chaperone protein dnaJ 49 n=1 Tax=Artemisia annua TaxID=35608 RepID=A0A2U1PZV0_ARTAN|nr:chaperone protein dnaJ 49 [Artemisia annua]
MALLDYLSIYKGTINPYRFLFYLVSRIYRFMNVSNEPSEERFPLKQTSKVSEPANFNFSKIPYGELTISILSTPSRTIHPLSYSLGIDYGHQVAMKTKEHGIEFYMKSDEFDQKFPVGTRARADMEDYIYESSWHIQRPNFPTPSCDLSTKYKNVIP